MSKEEKVGFFGLIAKYFKDLISEIKKISWPEMKISLKNTGVVLASVLIVGVFVFALDSGLYALLGSIMNLTK